MTCFAAQAATTDELLRMTEQLDQMDKLDFDQAIDRANRCTQARDFACTEAQLAAARKLATGSATKASLAKAESRLVAEKEALEAERVALAKRQRELEEEERRLKLAEERAARQAAAQAEEDSGMSTAQGMALFGTLLGQAYQNQAAARLAEAANARRIQQQLYASQADVARNQQRFAEERARLEAQRANLQRPQPQGSATQTQPQTRTQAQVPSTAAQATPSTPSTPLLAQNNARQAQLQRELDAAAAQRAQASQAAQTAQATAQRLQADARTAAPTQLASNTNTMPNTTPANTAGQDSRIKLYGTMYVVHYAALKHSRSDKNNITLVEQITPVQWTFDVPRVSPLQQPSGHTDAVPYQVSDLLLKQMRPKFFDYLRGKYTICIEGGNPPDGCHGWSVYHQIGNSAAEVQGKLNTSLRSFSAPITNDSGLDYPDSVAYRE
ncbi:hypothetical protein [Variovorax sp. HJSM1_2]|uniref:hypothetical protein n=1 Tax=Variovorax sp. HJSM1_2 TaxID=3366263 RepID=UPI003BC827B7